MTKREDVYEIADWLFSDEFILNQSCSVTGYFEITGGRLCAKGERVLEILEGLDLRRNCDKGRRKRVKLPNTVGGFVAQKIWKWKMKIVDQEPRYTIWRIQ